MSLIVVVMMFGGLESVAAEVNRVAIVPFKVNAEKDLSFLRDGIVDMLTSRLSVEDKVVVLCREEIAKVLKTVSPPINESKAREIGSQLGVDYVLFGSLTVFGERRKREYGCQNGGCFGNPTGFDFFQPEPGNGPGHPQNQPVCHGYQ